MGLIRRLIGIVFGTAGLIGLLLCVAGIVGCWLAHSEVHRRVDRTFDRADSSLAQADQSLRQVGQRLTETQSELAALRRRESEMASQPPAGKSALRVLSKRAAASFNPQLGEARQMLVQATEVTLVVNGLMDALAELPLTERVNIDVDRLHSASDQLTDLNQRATKLLALLDKAAPDGDSEIEGESTRAGELLDRILAAVGDGSNRIDSARSTVERSQAKIGLWVDRLAIVITVLLVWIGAGQLSLLVHGKKLTFARRRPAESISQ
jgi:hypothetical protein